jgi:hypothetical protein
MTVVLTAPVRGGKFLAEYPPLLVADFPANGRAFLLRSKMPKKISVCPRYLKATKTNAYTGFVIILTITLLPKLQIVFEKTL